MEQKFEKLEDFNNAIKYYKENGCLVIPCDDPKIGKHGFVAFKNDKEEFIGIIYRFSNPLRPIIINHPDSNSFFESIKKSASRKDNLIDNCSETVTRKMGFVDYCDHKDGVSYVNLIEFHLVKDKRNEIIEIMDLF